MIDFRPVSINDKEIYHKYLSCTEHRGCEYTFANLIMWGEQEIAELDNVLLRLSFYEGHCSYAFPIGSGNKEKALEAIIQDAKERDIPLSFFGVYKEDSELLEKLYPEKFAFIKARDGFDYVYDINALSTLAGRKYHSKRNHLHRFKESFPDYTCIPLDKDNLHLAKELADKWYKEKLRDNPDSDYTLEQTALKRAFENYTDLEMEGLLLEHKGEVLAFSMGSRMSTDTFDVHFEKAVTPNAYVAINKEFSSYLKNKHPNASYLDREEDMGLYGLRKAKESYRPVKLIEKYRAVFIEENLKPVCPDDSYREGLWTLWQEAFGDTEDFLRTFWNTAFAPHRCRCIVKDKEALSALYIFDCIYKSEKLAYIYGVATAKAHRGKGLCNLLMADTHRYLKKNGYKGAILVPAKEELFAFYENMGYKTCTYVNESEITASVDTIPLTEITCDEYAHLRKNHLDESAVIQEGENLSFLSTYARFFKGENFILTAYIEDTKLNCLEILGSAQKYAEIVSTLNCEKGVFRTKGKDKPFAMFYPLTEASTENPSYLGFAFD